VGGGRVHCHRCSAACLMWQCMTPGCRRRRLPPCSDWRWYTWAQLDDMAAAEQLHPVVERLVKKHRSTVNGLLQLQL